MRGGRGEQGNRGEGLLQEQEQLDLAGLDGETWKSGNGVDTCVEIGGIGVVVEESVSLSDGFEEIEEHHHG